MLLNNCPRLTHLSLTGVQAFLRDDLVTFCREAPRGTPAPPCIYSLLIPTDKLTHTSAAEFNDHQRDMFCVFSGVGVTKLRDYLNDGPTIPAYGAEPTNFTEEGDGGDTVNVYAGHGAGAGAGIDTGAGAGAAAGAVPAGPPFAVDEYHHQGVVQQQVAGVAAWLGATFIEEVDNDLDENSVFTDEN